MNILTDKQIRRAIWESMYQSTPWEHFHIHISEEDKAIAEVAHRETLKMVKVLILQAIADEPDFPGEMPDELWEEIKDNREVATETLRITVRLTKNGITDRFLEALNQSGEE